MIYTLNYINLPSGETINLDKPFWLYGELRRWVVANHPDFSSFQVIATKRQPQV